MNHIIETITAQIETLTVQLEKLETARNALIDIEAPVSTPTPRARAPKAPKTPKGDFVNVVHAELARLDQNTSSGLAKALGEPQQKVLRALNALKKAGRVEQRGTRKGASWAVVGGS